MECQDIREHLSGYIDNALDQDERDIVEKHLADCNACRKELDLLKALVKEISSVELVKPPDDFLFQIHKRMDPGFSLAGIARKLFVPFRIKIPMQFAATVAVCVLILFIINTPEVKKEMSDLSQKTPGLGISEYVFKDALDEETAVPAASEPSAEYQDDIKEDLADAKEPLRRIQPLEKKMQKRNRTDKIAAGTGDMSGAEAITGRNGMLSGRVVPQGSETVAREKVLAEHEPRVKARIAESALEKSKHKKYASSPSPAAKPIEIALVLDRGISQPSAVTGKDSRAPVSRKKSMGALEKENLKKETMTARIDAAHPEKKPEELQVNLHTLVESVQGKVVTISYDNNNRPAALLADIPADNYALFCGKLNEIGRFLSPPPTADMDGNIIRILVRFVSN